MLKSIVITFFKIIGGRIEPCPLSNGLTNFLAKSRELSVQLQVKFEVWTRNYDAGRNSFTYEKVMEQRNDHPTSIKLHHEQGLI